MQNENMRVVYEQYWLHARHAENETWLFTTVYGIIMAAIFAAVGAEISEGIKATVTLFGVIFSVLGFLLVYVFRVPFLKFALMAELIAIKEFKIKDEYRRFFPKEGKAFPEGKWFDLHDILAMFYALLTGVMTGFSINFFTGHLLGSIIPAVVISIALVGFHYGIIRRIKYIKEISHELAAKI